MIITASLTCDRARGQQHAFNKLALKYANQLNFAIVYTLEAHPIGSASPYTNSGTSNPANFAPNIATTQHQSLADRTLAALQFIRHFNIATPIFLDTMADTAWHALGAGPNIAVIVTPEGNIAFKQSWLDTEALQRPLNNPSRSHVEDIIGGA